MESNEFDKLKPGDVVVVYGREAQVVRRLDCVFAHVRYRKIHSAGFCKELSRVAYGDMKLLDPGRSRSLAEELQDVADVLQQTMVENEARLRPIVPKFYTRMCNIHAVLLKLVTKAETTKG